MTQQTPEEENARKLIGQTVGGKYSVVRLLGEGGMGCVYEAHQKLGDTVRKVAIKTLHEHLSHDPKILQRFEREVGTVAALTHPNTIQVYDFGKTDNGTLYIAMEFVQGKSVAEELEKNGPMEPTRVVKILEQVCGSLEEAHNAGIVHRDLKPDNVVLCDKAGQKDWVEVLDFGIAKRGSETDPNEQKLTQQGMVLGTPPYMSPEQFTGQPIDRRSDIYALGVMAYEMLTGRMPFSGNTAWEWATAHMTAQPVALDLTPQGPNLPPHMKAAIMKALEKNKDARWATVHDFMDAFAGRTAGAPVHSGTAAMAAPAPTRQKTEMGGAPVAMDFGTPPPAQGFTPPQGQAMGSVPYVAGTPAAGNLSYPAPVPAAHQPSGGGGKGLIIGLLILALLVFGGLGAFAFYHSQQKNTAVIPPIPTSTATEVATSTATDTASTTAPTDTGLPSLHATGTTPPVFTGTVTPKHDAGPIATTTTTATATATATQTATATATHTATATATQTAAPPPGGGDPNLPSCVVARAFCSKGAPACEAKKALCLAQGGKM